MAVVTFKIEDELEKQFRELASMLYGTKRGSFGRALSEAIALWIRERSERKIAERQLAYLEKGFALGRWRHKCREALYE